MKWFFWFFLLFFILWIISAAISGQIFCEPWGKSFFSLSAFGLLMWFLGLIGWVLGLIPPRANE